MAVAAGAKKKLQIHPAGLLIIMLSLAAWVVALGGVGSSTAQCVKLKVETLGGATAVNVTQSTTVKINCAFNYQGLVVALVRGVHAHCALWSFFESFNKGKLTFIIFYVLVTGCLMYANNGFITNAAKYSDKGYAQPKAQQTADAAGAAGYTMLCIFNFCLLIILSHEGLADASGAIKPASDMDVIPMNPV